MDTVKVYRVRVNGWEDDTIFDIELTIEEFKTIIKFAKLCNVNATSNYMPSISVYSKDGVIEYC